ncbi:MAG TPA: hypothetical protein VEZ42_01165, partial [Pseudonocardia sp.]|nr:hypothetical protein [Pseudonocardia sp.]
MVSQTLLAVSATAIGVLFVLGWRVADRRDEAARGVAVAAQRRTAGPRIHPPAASPPPDNPPPLP